MNDEKNFWSRLAKPVFVLAPLADVTDAAFRRVIAKYGKPDVLWTEFVSADGLMRASEEGKRKLLKDLIFTEAERPIVAQLFSSSPHYMREAAALCKRLGFDGIDINMGCPDKGIEKQGAGAAMIKTPALAREVLRAAIEGADGLPVSVKTRLGYNTDELDTWLPELLAEDPAVVTIHARTRKDMSKVPARWEAVARAVQIRDELGSKSLIFGNGDALDIDDARKKALASGADGVMLGRAIFGNPWLFAKLHSNAAETSDEGFAQGELSLRFKKDERASFRPPANPSSEVLVEERLSVLIEHCKLFEELLGDIKSFAIMKKHFKSYLSGIPNSGELKERLMATSNADEVETAINDFLGSETMAL